MSKILQAVNKGLWAVSLLAVIGCDRNTSSAPDSKNTTTRAEEDLAELREWVNNKTNNLDSTSTEKWPQVKEGFKEKSAKLDSRFDSLSAQSKEEYKELRQKFQNWEIRNRQRNALPLHPETLQRVKRELLGSATALDSTWTAQAVLPMYTRFLENVQTRRTAWTAADWDYANKIFDELNQKKEPLEKAIPTKDRLKIKALQARYLAFETSKDAKDLYKELR